MAERAVSDNPARALLVALGVALVCALAVSVTAIALRPYYIANQKAEREAQLGSILAALSETTDSSITLADIEARVVELDSGRYAGATDAATYDARKAALDPERSIAVPAGLDPAGLGRRADYAVVFIVRGPDSVIESLILPVYGSGYQSTLYGFLALSGDFITVEALKFYEQNDTPGMGGRIQDPEWESKWPGKLAFDESGRLRIGVARAKVLTGSENAYYQVDGISGATRTSLGVDGLLRFWLGDLGFGPYLERLRRGED